MTKLYLFTVFHANFAFSSIPSSHYSRIIDRCLWPVIDLVDRYPQLRIGVEFPAHSLAVAAKEDPLFLCALRRLIGERRLEVLGSGLVQSIFPLIPERANRKSLELGQDRYQELIGSRPATAFANEQVMSTSLLELYRAVGFQAVVADWENSQAACALARSAALHPLRLASRGEGGLTVLWNSTVGCQKFQRYLHGELELRAYLDFILGHWSSAEERVFCLYGGDWEIIDYRPGDIDFGYGDEDGKCPACAKPSAAGLPVATVAPAGRELMRLEHLIRALQSDPRIGWLLPCEAKKIAALVAAPTLSSPETPLPTKKQPRYNPTRWAVSGRSSPTANAQCFLLYRALRRLEALAQAGLPVPSKAWQAGSGGRPSAAVSLAALWEELCFLWGSDFRTHTTTEKWLDFNRRMGHALSQAQSALAAVSRDLAEGHDLALFNPLERDWRGHPFELPVHFAPGLVCGQPTLLLDGTPARMQLERPRHYRDGSLEQALLVLCPQIPARSRVLGTFADGESCAPVGRAVSPEGFQSAAVRLAINPNKGGTIRSLVFPSIADSSLAGTIDHGFLPQIDLSPDWYSGGVVIIDQDGAKITDLGPASVHPVPFSAAAPVRLPVSCRVESAWGPMWKTYYLYEDEPRVDLRYHFRFGDLRPRSFRLGILTLDPRAFARDTLRYCTVNGYREVESFALAGHRVEQDQPVSFSVSARGCVGATEGWIDVGDDRHGLALIRDLSELYTVPLVHYEEVEDLYLLRVYLSAGESDETSAVLWRGHVELGVRYYAHRADSESVRAEAERCNVGLQVAWGRPERVRGR